MLHGQQINSKFIGAVFASALLLANLAAAEPQHGIAMYGDPALPHDFVSLPYANPDAPKGGTIVSAEGGTFDSHSIRMSARARCLGSFAFWPMRA